MRLIDADALLKEDFTDRFVDFYDNTVFEVIVEEARTVDIKTEVAREIFAEIDKRLDELMVIVSPNDGFITTFRKTMEKVTVEIAELKNKYTKEGV